MIEYIKELNNTHELRKNNNIHYKRYKLNR